MSLETTPFERKLIEAAVDIRANAYAPYSHYRVGAAAAAGEKIFAGVNIENASYGGTICAERIAIGAAITAGFQSFDCLVVATPDAASPCGICRQFLAEFGSDLPVLLVHSETRSLIRRLKIADLLPYPFVKFEPDA